MTESNKVLPSARMLACNKEDDREGKKLTKRKLRFFNHHQQIMLPESSPHANEKTGFFKGQETKSNTRLPTKRLFSLDLASDTRARDSLRSSVKSSNSSTPLRRKRCTWIIPHNSNSKILWDWFVLLLVLYTAVQIPYQAAFPWKNSYNSQVSGVLRSGNSAVLIAGYIVDAFFFLDIFVNFLTSYPESATEEVVTNHRKIAIHYLKTWFTVDFIAVIPFDWFIDEIRPESEDTATLFGLLKSARLLRLFRVARKLDRYSEYGIAVLFLLMSMFTLIAHWLACIWHVIGDKQPMSRSGWLQLQALDSGAPIVNGTVMTHNSVKYIASLYFVLSSLTSVGFGNVSANTEYEQIFMIVVMLLGALMYATVFGNMVAIVQRLYSRASRFHSEMNMIKEFLRFYKIPEDLRQSIQTYVRQAWTFTEGVDVQKVLKQFPMSLQMDICFELYQGLFVEVKALRGATVSCMRTMGRSFRTIHLQVGHYILRQGDQVEYLYVIGRGAMEIIKDGELASLLAKHTLVGYDFKTNPLYPKANADLRASTSLELHYIHKDDLQQIFKAYQKFQLYFMENFAPAYNICDEFEEGLVRPSKTKSRLHLGAIAKTALRFSFLKFKTKSNLQEESPANDVDDVANESSSGVYIPNGHAVSDSSDKSLDSGNINVVSSGSISTPQIVVDAPSSPEIEHDVEIGGNKTDEITQKLVGLENRIIRVEKQILQFKNTFDVQMKNMLDVVKTLKVHLSSKETVTDVYSCRSNFEIEGEMPESGTMTSCL